ncbi:Metal-pseudopaline receptor CntO (plasmid) [Asticcacaulis sp. MM231]|uniref:TonB-dependent receptor n=1 Tax=Asticcacaulis sp. MM231 TaxID=3157666 RepID=UPI0032D582F0
MKSHLLLTVAISCLCVSGSAFAQATADDRATEVIVKGKLQTCGLGAAAPDSKVPLSTSTIDLDTVTAQGGTSFQDALRNVPGAQADLSFTGAHSPNFILRGAIADSGTGNSRILRDGARLSNYGYAQGFIGRIDVVRGAGATAAVRSEPGGTVDIITKTPQLRDFSSVYGLIGAHNQSEAWYDTNFVISKDKELAARLVLGHSSASEWRHVSDTLDGVKFAIAKSHSDAYHLLFDFEGTNQSYQPDFGVPAINGKPAAIPLDRQLGEPFAHSKTDNRIYTVHTDFKLAPAVTLYLDAVHADSEQSSIRNSVFSAVAGQTGVYTRATAYEPGSTRKTDNVRASLVASLPQGSLTHNLYASAETYRETLDLKSLRVPAANSPNIDIFNPVYGLVVAPTGTLAQTITNLRLNSQLYSLQDRIDAGKLGVVLGVEYVDQDFLYGTAGTLSRQEHRLNPKAGVTYDLTLNQTVYTSYATGTAPNQATSKANQSLPSRRSTQYEVGWKGRFASGTLRAGLAAYQLDETNLLADDPSTAYIYDKTIAGEGRSKGVEATLNGQVTERLSLDMAYANIDARYTRNSEFIGKRMANTARDTLSVFGHYQWSDSLFSGAGVYAQGKRFADEANTTVLPGYTRVDLVQGYRFNTAGKPVVLQLNVKNLFDQRYYAASHLHVARYILPGEGRNVSLSIGVNF